MTADWAHKFGLIVAPDGTVTVTPEVARALDVGLVDRGEKTKMNEAIEVSLIFAFCVAVLASPFVALHLIL
jgi:hypothetical protein